MTDIGESENIPTKLIGKKKRSEDHENSEWFLDEYDVLQQFLYLYGSMLLSHLCTRKPGSWTSVSEVPGQKPGFENLLFIKGKDRERIRVHKKGRTGGKKPGVIAGNVYRMGSFCI